MTKQNNLRLNDYLNHILCAIQRIYEYTDDIDELTFLKSPLIQDAVIRNFEIIGEAARKIEKQYAEFSEMHSYLPLGVAYEMRNVLIHGYFKVDLEIVWKTIERDLPQLFEMIQKIYTE